MGLIQLLTRADGTNIVQSWWNDIVSALKGDMVGRDTNGNPVSGNNLGTSLYPWGQAYVTSLFLNGTLFTTNQKETPIFQVQSGRARVFDSGLFTGITPGDQPSFLRPTSPAAPSFSLLTASGIAPLILQLKSGGTTTGVTFGSDKNGISVNIAPSSSNTITVSDANATGGRNTRTWGEAGYTILGDRTSPLGASPYYAITTSSMSGTAFAALVGTWQAFQIGSEYFIGFLESTTSITRCFRGFFLDLNGTPVVRSAFSNGATITLLNLGWVFADVDGVTINSIFANTNNAPFVQAQAPVAGDAPVLGLVTGDYWYNTGSQTWNIYGSGTWTQTNRMMIGYVVADKTNCVGARSVDFWRLVRSDNTVDLMVLSNTVVEGQGLNQRVSVYGNLIEFKTARPQWSTTNTLANSTDRINSTVQANSVEYFYITDLGDRALSDIAPHWRADLNGYYHPSEPWRCVGQCNLDGSTHFSASTLLAYGEERNFTTAGPIYVQQGIYPAGPSNARISGMRDSGSTSTMLSILDNGGTRSTPMVVSDLTLTSRLKIIRGRILLTGTTASVSSGEQFSLVRNSTGVYTLTFTFAFSDIPSVIATAETASCLAIVTATSTTGVVVRIAVTGTATDSTFCFMAIGQN